MNKETIKGFLTALGIIVILSTVIVAQGGGDNENHVSVIIHAPLTDFYTVPMLNHSRVLSIDVREHETEIIIDLTGLSEAQKLELYADFIRLRDHFDNLYSQHTQGIPIFNTKGTDLCLYDVGAGGIVRYFSLDGRIQKDVGDIAGRCLG